MSKLREFTVLGGRNSHKAKRLQPPDADTVVMGEAAASRPAREKQHSG